MPTHKKHRNVITLGFKNVSRLSLWMQVPVATIFHLFFLAYATKVKFSKNIVILSFISYQISELEKLKLFYKCRLTQSSAKWYKSSPVRPWVHVGITFLPTACNANVPTQWLYFLRNQDSGFLTYNTNVRLVRKTFSKPNHSKVPVAIFLDILVHHDFML